MTKHVSPEILHGLTIGALLRGVRNMDAIMDKAEKHAASQNLKLDALTEARLYPDMFNLLQQVQYVCYLAVDLAQHFSNVPCPRVGYDEASWEDLRQSLHSTADYLATISAGDVVANSDKTVPTFMDSSMGMPVMSYAADVIVPDFNFHLVIAYGILRHKGVPLGKSDFLGELNLRPMQAA